MRTRDADIASPTSLGVTYMRVHWLYSRVEDDLEQLIKNAPGLCERGHTRNKTPTRAPCLIVREMQTYEA